MHELALGDQVVQTVLERVPDARVVRVRLAVGRLAAVLPDALRFCFDVCAQGTRLEGAVLEIDERPARLRCRSCGDESESEDALPLCRCGSADVEVTSGYELQIQDVEVS